MAAGGATDAAMMQRSPGEVFDGRYRLVERIGDLCAFGQAGQAVGRCGGLLQHRRNLGLHRTDILGRLLGDIAGALADRIGAHETLLGCGVIIVLSTLVFASGRKSWIKSVRPALQRNGTIE